MMRIVVIASSTRGFAAPRDGTPPVINPCPSAQDQDEKRSLPGAFAAEDTVLGGDPAGVPKHAARRAEKSG
jgi:hypothetical protein